VRTVEPLRQVGAQIDGELERLPAVAKARFSLVRQLADIGERADDGPDLVAPRIARDEAERGENARGVGNGVPYAAGVGVDVIAVPPTPTVPGVTAPVVGGAPAFGSVAVPAPVTGPPGAG